MTEQPEPNARQRLLDALRTGACFCGADSCRNPEPLVDAYAHELAEQQRAHGNAEDGEPGCWHDGVTTAANLIDPEKQR